MNPGDFVWYRIPHGDGFMFCKGKLIKKLLEHWFVEPIDRPGHVLPKLLLKRILYQEHEKQEQERKRKQQEQKRKQQ